VVASDGITLIPNVFKISHLAQKLKANRQHGYKTNNFDGFIYCFFNDAANSSEYHHHHHHLRACTIYSDFPSQKLSFAVCLFL
jgi:hypothetical protein